MTLAPILLTAIVVTNTLVGLFVWTRNSSSAANRSFTFLAVSVALWTLGISVAHHADILPTASTRYTFAAASLILVAILLVSHSFPDRHSLTLDLPSRCLLAVGLAFVPLALTPVLVTSARREATVLIVSHGSLYRLYGVYVLCCLAWSFRTLLRRYRASTGLTRLQFRYFALGLLIPGIGISITNLLIPLLFRSSRLGQYGPFFALIFLLFTAHVLIRYRLLDIRLVLRRSATAGLALMVSVILVASLLLLARFLLGLSLPGATFGLLLLTGALIGVLLHPSRVIIARLLDLYTYRAPADYAKTLRIASDALSRTLDLSSLAHLLVDTVLQATKAEDVSLYLSEESGLHLIRTSTYLGTAPPSLPPSISPSSPLIIYLAQSNQPLVAEEIARKAPPHDPDLLRALPDSHWAVLVPLTSDDALIGLLSVGPKLARDPFFSEDIEFLSTVAAQSATAVTNARLYRQVLLVNEYLNNILRTMDSAVIAVSRSGHITLFNLAAERLTGIPKEDASTQSLDALPTILRDALLAALDTASPHLSFETSLPRTGGYNTPLLCSTSPLMDSRGSVLGAVLVFTDLTALKHLEAQKQQAERLASIGSLASGIAHEIKNPLVAIRTFAELLPERFSDPEFRDSFARVSIAEIQRIDSLIARLRGLSPPSSATILLVDIRRPLEETLSLLRAGFEQQAIKVSRTIQADNCCVLGDVDQLKQLFLNLLLNAVQAMPTGGVLSINLANKLAGPSARLLLEVSDTGEGVPPSLLPTIFDPFVTTKPAGSGLGLAISRHIADLHGANIAVENNPHGPGVTVTLDFPVAVGSAEAPFPALSSLTPTPG